MATLGVTGRQNLAAPQLRVWREVCTWARTPHLFGNNLGLEGHWLHPWVRARHPSLPALGLSKLEAASGCVFRTLAQAGGLTLEIHMDGQYPQKWKLLTVVCDILHGAR